MFVCMKMSFADKLLILLFLSSLLSTQLGCNFDPRTSSIQEPTPSDSNTSCTVEEELAGSIPTRSVSTNPPGGVEEEEQDWSAPETYLYSGDASVLSSSSCYHSFQLTDQHSAVPQDIKVLLSQTTVSLINAVNFLNLIFQASELRETSIREDIEWYHALIRSLLVGEKPSLVRHALLRFDADPTASQPQLVLWASKGTSQDIYLQDLTLAWDKLHILNYGLDQAWFTLLKSNSLSFPSLSKQVLLNDLSTLDTPKWAHGGTYVTNSSGLQWGEAPYLECKDGRFLPGWLLTLSMPFYGLKPDLSPEFRGVIRVDVNIQDFDVNQCVTGDFWFADTHQCNRTSMQCEPIPRQGFRLGQYCCRCKEGYYSLPAATVDQCMAFWPNHTRGVENRSSVASGCYPVIPVCVPCWPGCKQCQDGSPCWIQEDWYLRAVLLTVHGFFMALVLLSMLRVYQCRETKPIRASGLLLLEIILFGSLLLYFPVLIIFFKASAFRCILLRWVRLLGFAIVYGTVTLKMYRLLNVFLSCTAKRVPYMSSTSVLRILGVMVLTVKWFLCAWTVGVLQNRDRNIPLLRTSSTSDGQSFRACDLDSWDYMMAMAELLFLCWGISLSSAVKAVPSAFHEPRYMGIAIHNELLFSTMFHLIRFIKPSLHPDWMLLLFFIHIHVTITVTLGLLLFPKFLHISQLIKEDIASEMYEEEVDLQRSCLHLNNSFKSTCWSDHNLDPDDIRGELKKLYAQLEVHKTKKMENNNPHLQKKRSSCLRIGRSLIRRMAEIPESISRQASYKEKDTSGAVGTRKGSGSCLATSESVCVIMRNETVKLPSSDMVHQKCASMRDTLLMNYSVKNCTNKRSSETESIDTAPLFCKSVSAQNLAVDNNFLQPLSPRVQKSFSFTEKHRDHYPLSPSKSRMDTSHVFETSPKEMSYDKAKVKEEQPTDTNVSNQKHVSEQETLTPKLISTPSLLYVCPWEFSSSLPSSSCPVANGKSGLDSDVESSIPKPPISSSAPGTPYNLAKPMGHCGFSFHSATQTLLLAKGLVAKKGSGKYISKNELCKEEGTSQQTRSVTTGSAMKSVKKSPQAPVRSMTSVDSKPCLVKQAAIRASPERNSRSNVPPHIHLWKSETVEYENTIQSQGNGKQRTCLNPCTESTNASWLQDTAVPRSTLYRIDSPNKTYRQVSIADICPWDVEQQDHLQPKGFCDDQDYYGKANLNQMQITTVDKGIAQESLGQASGINRKGSEPQSHTEADVFHCNVKQDSAKSVSEATKPTERVIYVNAHPDTKKQSLEQEETLRTDVCPWEASDTHRNQEITCVDVYPWKGDAIVGKYSETIGSTESKSLSAPSPKHLLTKQITSTAPMDICPWDFPERFSSQWESEKLHESDAEKPRDDAKNIAMPFPQSKQLTSTAEICPWDFPESPSIVKEVFLKELKEASKKEKQKDMELPSQVSITKQTDSSSQEAEVTDRPRGTGITQEADISVLQEESVHAKICLWENITQENEKSVQSSQRQATPLVDSFHAGEPDICPWESEQSPKSARSQNYHQEYICPWELPVSGNSHMQASVCVDVSSWKTNSDPSASTKGRMNEKLEGTSAQTVQGTRANRPLTRSDALCPWEMRGGSEASITDHDNNSDIFTWEEPIAEERDAETAAEAFIFPPDL